MNRIKEIIKKPQTYKNENRQLCHESLLQSYSLLDYVMRLYEMGTPYEVVSELVWFIKNNSGE
jgi:hypothetical protein